MGVFTTPVTWFIVLAVSIGVSIYSFRLQQDFNDLNQAPTINEQGCTRLTTVGSVTDLIVDTSTGHLYLTSGKREHRLNYYPPFGAMAKGLDSSYYRDQVVLYNFQTQTVKELKFENFDGQEFIGHGVALTRSSIKGDYSNYLYFLNHKRFGSVISVFKHLRGSSSLTFSHEFKSPSFIRTPSSVIAVSPHEVYITNDHYFQNSVLRNIENRLSPLPLTNVVRCEYEPRSRTTSCREVVKGLASARGMEYLPESNELAVAESHIGVVGFYSLTPRNSTESQYLPKTRQANIGAPLVNIRRVPGTSDLLVTVTSDSEQVFPTVDKLEVEKPTDEMAVLLSSSNNYDDPVLVYHGKGDELSHVTSFSMVPQKRQLIGGSAINEGLLVCSIDYSLFGMEKL